MKRKKTKLQPTFEELEKQLKRNNITAVVIVVIYVISSILILTIW